MRKDFPILCYLFLLHFFTLVWIINTFPISINRFKLQIEKNISKFLTKDSFHKIT